MGRIIGRNKPCRRCSSSDAAQEYESGWTHCFSCSANYKTNKDELSGEAPYRKVRNEQQLVEEVTKEFDIRGMKDRLITKKVCEFTGVRCSINERGEIAEYYFPDIKDGRIRGYKVKNVKDKTNQRIIGEFKTMFNIDPWRSGGKRIIVTEGEEDALAVGQALHSYYGQFYPFASMGGVDQTKYLLKERDILRKFEEVILWFDNDEQGQAALHKAAGIVGYDKVKLVSSDVKDACDKLRQTGNSKEEVTKFLRLVWDASETSPASIVKGEDTWETYKEYKNIEYVPWPPFLSRLNELTYGRALGSITMIAAGCHAAGTEFLMYDGCVKKVEDVRAGDKLAGPDGSVRNVLSTATGREQMYRIQPIVGDHSMEVNENHILSLVYTLEEVKYKGIKRGDIVNVTVKEYLTWSETKKKWFKGYFGSGFEGEEKDLSIDPWLLGVWLGDGTAASARITTADEAVVATLSRISEESGFQFKKTGKELTYSISGGLQKILRLEALLDNKHIPEDYLLASREQRLALLAGLIDSDGYYSPHGYYEITQKNELLIEQIRRLCTGLGFRTSLRKKFSAQWGRNYYRLTLWGEGCEDIPVVLERKKYTSTDKARDSRVYGFAVHPLKVDTYYGVVLDGDHLYQLANGVVTHNTSIGKSTLLREDLYHLLKTTDDKIGACFLEESIGETVAGVISLELNKRITLPNVETTEEEEKTAWSRTLGQGRTLFVDHQGSVSDGSLLDKLEYLALSGCKYIYLDHITIAVSESDERDTNKAIDVFMSSLLKLVKRYNIWVGVVSHLRKVKQGEDSFESGGQIFEDDLKGSGSLKQISFQTIAISRNKLHQDEKKRNQSQLWLLKDRKTGNTGPAGAYSFNGKTGRLEFVDQDKDSFEEGEVEII